MARASVKVRVRLSHPHFTPPHCFLLLMNRQYAASSFFWRLKPLSHTAWSNQVLLVYEYWGVQTFGRHTVWAIIGWWISAWHLVTLCFTVIKVEDLSLRLKVRSEMYLLQNVKWRQTLVWDQSLTPNLPLRPKFVQRPNLISAVQTKQP